MGAPPRIVIIIDTQLGKLKFRLKKVATTVKEMPRAT
jgi:hypothetical protein